MVKVNYVDTIVPIMKTLRSFLIRQKSSLLKDLMNCLHQIFRGFKHEVLLNFIVLDGLIVIIYKVVFILLSHF